MPLPPDFQFSQHNLQDFIDCPRRFYLRYFLRMRYPAPISEPVLEQEKRIEQGEHFHRLVHQHLIGIPEASLSNSVNDPILQVWWENYLSYHPTGDLPAPLSPEYTLWMRFSGFQFIAKYDLIAIGNGKAFIFDWKTSDRQPGRAYLAQRMQTRVYPFLLVEAGARLNGGNPIQPEQVQMTYWFPQVPQSPVTFPYSASQYQEDKTFLESLIEDIPQRRSSSFLQTLDERRCRYCNYRSYCDRGREAGDVENFEEEATDQQAIDIDLDTIEEIAF